MGKLLVFIPMYNCEKQIKRVLKQFDKKFIGVIDEIILVNNISTDNSEATAIEYLTNIEGFKIKILRNNVNYGLGGSHKVAFNYAIENDYDYIVVLHGDDQGNINDLFPYLLNGDYKKYDCFLGARFHPKSIISGYSLFRRFGNLVYNFLFSIVSKRWIYDLGSGLNCYKVEKLKDKYYLKFPDDLTFNYCMVLSEIYLNQKVSFFPLTWREDDQISNVKLFRQSIKVLKLLIQFAINKKQFIQNEHRSKNIKSYISDIVASN